MHARVHDRAEPRTNLALAIRSSIAFPMWQQGRRSGLNYAFTAYRLAYTCPGQRFTPTLASDGA